MAWHRGTTPGQEFYVFDENGKAIVESVERKHVPLLAAAPALAEQLQKVLNEVAAFEARTGITQFSLWIEETRALLKSIKEA